MARRRVLVWPVAQVEWIVGRRLEADMEEFVRLAAAARRLAREQLLLENWVSVLGVLRGLDPPPPIAY